MNIACHVPGEAQFEQLRVALARAGFACERFASDSLLLRAIHRRSFDFILIDLGDSQANDNLFSWLTCRAGENTPVLVLSALRNAEWVAELLNAGADDVLLRPFEEVELVARIRAVLRRAGQRQARRAIDMSGFQLDREAASFCYLGQAIELTPREFTMAWLFFSSPGVYISRETIGSAIWGTGSEVAGRTIEQHVYKLRKKLSAALAGAVNIRTAYNQGYRLELAEQDAAPTA
ncbi:response regulator transcription factor [Rugamonas sp. CCM 8940]|uniref:response regulator transcription factor n=1 Tax=Rugamonas sp. CCM 8940 TaxID=2765359 RepID=UPI0018F5BB24|nr:response regulator transcription factor [Rugamonas sp. CCM 8940]MBJ7311946.1 response regulator transcription factor [Rugamonas sp. CCM 8940]